MIELLHGNVHVTCKLQNAYVSDYIFESLPVNYFDT